MTMSIDERFNRRSNIDHNGQSNPLDDTVKISYGTAGFREKAEVLPFVALRVGYLAALRSRVLNKAIGLMITASHNPQCDNGVKIVDPNGEMLASEWENHATMLVSIPDDELLREMKKLEETLQLGDAKEARVICAVDTRPSGQHLADAAKAGAALCNVDFEFLGLLTTPQLHYAVRVQNDPAFGPPGEDGYYTKIGTAFRQFYELLPNKSSPTLLMLDCANGVGAPKARKLFDALPKNLMEVDFKNEVGELNHECGADFVKICKQSPVPTCIEGVRCASLDGDADRLVYFYSKNSESKNVILLDGDKIAVLFAKFLIEELKEAKVFDQLTIGIVQTAYANGASSAYIKNQLGVDPIFVPTGVKHLHHEAMKYDIGVYFEANGHGTICFSDHFKSLISGGETSSPPKNRLYWFSQLINEVVGDALADLLAVELLLKYYGWTVEDWANKLYHDAPNIQIKVPVTDRSIFQTTWDETRLIAPLGLQDKIDHLVNELGAIRAFARPSGTEKTVRVYAEAEDAEVANKLGEKVAEIIRNFN
ncbi:unnamed protein product, partial [Mesorhabditis belari]|uniref:Phosphoacetylglucosamine mutase n=1 Tax=Mesorhabditis belari TaxID=2138241 RepID=A0AAF3F2V5_9BILA